ncbi:MAG: YhcH/YjgK/YiaL family protein [Clostridia bacterium]|nr:YhcH/YjgK/YiaL family protein [Clostridia bacterium]
MIYDILSNLSCYRGLSANMDRALEALASTDFSAQPAGKYEIDGDNVFYMIQEPELRDEESALYEIHKKYADIQFALTDGETILALPTSAIEDWQPFDEARDIGFSMNTEPGIPLEMNAGSFAIFFPQDAHMPCLRGGNAKKCRKVVFKVKL